MKHIYYHATPVSLWYDLVLDAEHHANICLTEELEQYIVGLLSRYVDNTLIGRRVLGQLFLESQWHSSAQQLLELRHIGDECLLIAGFFPNRAQRRATSIYYFVELGQIAFKQLFHKSHNALYDHISGHFCEIIELLHAVRWMASLHCADAVLCLTHDSDRVNFVDGGLRRS